MIDLFRGRKADFIPKRITEKQSTDTGMAMVLICLLISVFGNSRIASAIAIVLLILNMTVPKIFTPLAKVWIGFAIIVGNVVSRILLTVIFYLLVTPVGLVRKFLGADAMQVKQWKKGNASVFQERNHVFSPADIEKPY